MLSESAPHYDQTRAELAEEDPEAAKYLGDFYALKQGCGEAVESDRSPAWKTAMRHFAGAYERFQASMQMAQLRKGI